MFLSRAIITDVRKGFREGSLIGKEDPNRLPGERNDNVLGIEQIAGPREEVKVGDWLFITKYEKNDKQRIYVAEVGYFWCGEEHRGAKVKKLEDGRYAVHGGAYRYREYGSLEEIKRVSPAEAKAVEDYLWEEGGREEQMKAYFKEERRKKEEKRRREAEETQKKVKKAWEMIKTTQEPFKIHRAEKAPYIIVNGVHFLLSIHGQEFMKYIDLPSLKNVRPYLLEDDREFLEENIYQEEKLILSHKIKDVTIDKVETGFSSWTRPDQSEYWDKLLCYTIHFEDGSKTGYELAGVKLSAAEFPDYIRNKIKMRVDPATNLNHPDMFDELLDAVL